MRLLISILAVAALADATDARDFRVEAGLTYASPKGRDVSMTLWLPAVDQDAPRPAAVLIHGGGWTIGTRHQLRWYGRNLARNGYVAMAINYRKWPRYGFPACVEDCKAAVRWLRLHAQEYNVDPERITALGNSAGGHLTALLATASGVEALEGDQNPGVSSEIAAGISLYGPADLRVFQDRPRLLGLNKAPGHFIERFVGKEPIGKMAPFDAASPLYHASPESSPLLFIHGTRDFIVPYAQSENLYARLRELGVPTRMLTLPGYNHAFDFVHPRIRERVFAEILTFLDEHAGSAPEPPSS